VGAASAQEEGAGLMAKNGCLCLIKPTLMLSRGVIVRASPKPIAACTHLLSRGGHAVRGPPDAL